MTMFLATIIVADLSTSNESLKDYFHKEEIVIDNNVKDGGITYKYVISNDPTDISIGNDIYKCIGNCEEILGSTK